MDRVISIACIVLFAALVLTVVWQVIARQVLQNPSVWSEELARYVFVWLGFFGAALVFSERGHIAMDFLVRKLPNRWLRVALILAQLAISGFIAVVFVWGGLRYVEQAWTQSLSALPLTVGPMFLVMPISGALIIWYSVLHLVEALTSATPRDLLVAEDVPVIAPPTTDTLDEGPSSDTSKEA
ncbi:TRAP transporter small permease [Actinotalea sp.]|uniref:TRAP transporter small permease n=1 Tax=Actinotalea sp. TaxID=1872145 RepID=UPI00356A76C1